MATMTGLAQWGTGGPVSIYLLITPIGREDKHLTLAVQEQLFFSKLKPQHSGFNCSIGTLK